MMHLLLLLSSFVASFRTYKNLILFIGQSRLTNLAFCFCSQFVLQFLKTFAIPVTAHLHDWPSRDKIQLMLIIGAKVQIIVEL